MMRILISVVLLLSISTAAMAAVIDKVDISGNKRITISRINKYLVKAGDEFDPAKLNQSVKELNDTGFFTDISVDASVVNNQFVITYILQENPLIAEIKFKGNDNFKPDKFNEKLKIKVGEYLNLKKIGNTIAELQDFYESERYYNVKITHELVYRNESAVTVVFNIEEGTQSRVYNIWFYGNSHFTNAEIKEAMLTKEKDYWSKINSSGTLVTGRMEVDREFIRMLYMSAGYLDIEIGEPEIVFQKDPSRLNYLVRIKEGPRYKVNKVSYQYDTSIISEDNISAITKVKQDEYFNVSAYQEDIHNLSEIFSEIGYARAFVDAQTMINRADLTVDVLYSIIPGNIYHINRITFTGNEKTKDNVLRRQFDIVEGGKYNSKLLKEARSNLMSTGFFESVDIADKYPNDDTADIVVTVKEKQNNTLSMSIAYSSLDELTGALEYQFVNAFGYGTTMSLKTEVSKYKHLYMVSFQEPWIYDRPYSAGFRIYYEENKYRYSGYSDYTRDSIALQFNVGHQLIKRRLYVNYILGHERLNIKDINDNASNYIKRQKGITVINSITPALTYQDLNDNLDPSKGIRLDARAKIAPEVFGATAEFTKLLLKANFYKPLQYSLVTGINIEGGHIWSSNEQKIPVDERFFLGGINSIRGYESGDIGPKDSEGEAYGGVSYYQGNFEVWRPIFTGNMSIRLVTFFDIGQVYAENKLFTENPRMSVGGGIRFFTPMGLIRLEYGAKLNRKPGEAAGALEFSVGSVF